MTPDSAARRALALHRQLAALQTRHDTLAKARGAALRDARDAGANMSALARAMGVTRATLYEAMRRE